MKLEKEIETINFKTVVDAITRELIELNSMRPKDITQRTAKRNEYEAERHLSYKINTSLYNRLSS